MNYEDLVVQTRPFDTVVQMASVTIIMHQKMFDIAGAAAQWDECEKHREIIKTQIDIQCDAKMASFRLVEKWRKAGSRYE